MVSIVFGVIEQRVFLMSLILPGLIEKTNKSFMEKEKKAEKNSLGNSEKIQRKINLQRCIQSASLRPGTHSFFFWTQRILNEGSNYTQKKYQIFMQITNSRKKERHTICKFLFRENNF